MKLLKDFAIATSFATLALGAMGTIPALAAEFTLNGSFLSNPEPGSDIFFQQFSNGSFDGTYSVEDDSLPAPSGTSFGLSAFNLNLRDARGNVVINYRSGQDSGGFFADFFGPGAGDGFVFNGSGTQFQIGFPSAFNGTDSAINGAVFGASGGPSGGIDIASGTSRSDDDGPTPVPEPASALGMLALGTIGGRSLLKRKLEKVAS